MIKIVVDCFGGDKSPDVNVEGSVLALKEHQDLSLILTGDEKIINEKLSAFDYDKERLEVVHAPQIIDPSEVPTEAIRTKKDSSLMKAIDLLRNTPDIKGLVSIGSTGALVAAGTLLVGRIKGIKRPTFCPVSPTLDGKSVGICDSGANVEVTPEYLRQFAIMGSIYMENVYGVKNPRVALLNVGVEEEKGDTIRKETYQLLKKEKSINFVGNMESRDLMSGKYDLIVCDGFSGNVLLKTLEGTALSLFSKLKKDIYEKPLYKLGALLMKNVFKKEKDFFDYNKYGGSPLIGTKKTIIKGHGSTNALGISKCIEQAYMMSLNGVNEKIENTINPGEILCLKKLKEHFQKV